MNVRFFGGTRKQYDSLATPRNPLGLYFCADTRELFWGDKLLTDGTRIITTEANLPNLEQAADGITYFVEETRNGYVISPDRTKWVKVIQAPIAGEGAEVDLSNYYTKAEVDAVILDAIANIEIEADLTGYATEQYVIDAIEAHANQVPVDELEKEVVEVKTTLEKEILPTLQETILPVVEKAATEDWVKEQGYLTEHQSLAGLATEEFVKQEIAKAELEDKDVDVSVLATKEDLAKIEAKIPSDYLKEIPSEYITESELTEAITNLDVAACKQQYEVLPLDGMVVSYTDTEVRVNTQHVDINSLPAQNAGDGSSSSLYYITFRAYAPANATKVIEGEKDKMDTMYSDLATDKYGRQYTTIWSAIASKSGSTWSKFGDKSTVDKYLGFYYNFHWYNDEDKLIRRDKVRVILTNDACHDDLVPDAVARRIDDKVNAVKLPDTSKFITIEDVEAKGYLTTKIANDTFATKTELLEKANEVVFTEDKIVTNSIGSFKTGDNVKGLTTAEIFAKLLGFSSASQEPDEPVEPDTPDTLSGIVENIITKQIPMLEVNENSDIVETLYNYQTFERTSDTNTKKPTETGFYQITENGKVTESGYQHVSPENDSMYYMVALPKDMDFNTNVTVYCYDVVVDPSNPWQPASDFAMSSDADLIAQMFAEAELPVPVVDQDVYKLWIDESGATYNGSIYRFVINE